MYVNPFWFGVLMTIVAAVVLLIIAAIIGGKIRDKGEEEEYKELMEIVDAEVDKMNGIRGRIKNADGMLEFAPDEDDSDAKKE